MNHNLIDWGKLYDFAKANTKEQFLTAVNKMIKIDELPLMERFITYMHKYEDMVLPKLLSNANIQLTPQAFVQIVINEVRKNNKLLEAFAVNKESMFGSIIAGAEIGLVPSELHGEFFLIPRNIKQDDGKYLLTVTPLIGYKGLAKILLRSSEIETIDAQIVYQGDKFSVKYGSSPSISHTPKFEAARTAANITHAYTVAHYKNGKKTFHVMTTAEITAVRDMSKTPNDLYFNDKKNPNRWMEKKACLIQMAKLMDKDLYTTQAIELDSRIESGAIITIDDKNEIKLIEGAAIRPARFKSVYGTLDKLKD